jgi:hypothetical protein
MNQLPRFTEQPMITGAHPIHSEQSEQSAGPYNKQKAQLHSAQSN